MRLSNLDLRLFGALFWLGVRGEIAGRASASGLSRVARSAA
jgi:hypothetical protein